MKNETRWFCLHSAIFFCFGICIIRLWFIPSPSFSLSCKKEKSGVSRGHLYDIYNRPLTHLFPAVSLYAQDLSLSNSSMRQTIHSDFGISWPLSSPFVWVKRKIDPQEAKIWCKKYPFLQKKTDSLRKCCISSCSSIVGSVDAYDKGISGLELQYETFLAQGKDVHLSLDSTTQEICFEAVKKQVEACGGQVGSCIVMDPFNGSIEALVDYYMANPAPALSNAVGCLYEYGSVIKIFLALAALHEKVVSPEEIIDCQGEGIKRGALEIKNRPHYLRKIKFSEVMRLSSNVGCALVAEKLQDKLYTHYEQLGFTSFTGVDFPGQPRGYVTPPFSWSSYSIYVLSFGYECSITLLHLAKALAVIANQGFLVTPHFIQRGPALPIKLGYTPEDIEKLRQMLKPIAPPSYCEHEYTMYGKTGSARLAGKNGYSEKEAIYTFAGVLDIFHPPISRVIVVSILKREGESGWATQIARPLFAQIARQLYLKYLTHP